MPKRLSLGPSVEEIRYIDTVRQYSKSVFLAPAGSSKEGFEYFESKEFVQSHSKYKSLLLDQLLSGGISYFFKIMKVSLKNMPVIMPSREKCYQDLNNYIQELRKNGIIENTNEHVNSYPNIEIWNDLIKYCKEKWNVEVGFTELPAKMIFNNKAVLFKYAIVCIQEMVKDKIDKAPDIEAGEEVLRVYKTLGVAVNNIAEYLRQRYTIKCQSNHPLGGLVNTTPLAGKAGMGWQGSNGLLITPKYGQRQRIAPIFIQNKLFEFTDNSDHTWIEDFCKTCMRCYESCPTQAIFKEKKDSIMNVDGIGNIKTCIDRDKCYPQFSKTFGCNICVRVCPFSQGENAYQRIKKAFIKNPKNAST